MFEDSSKHLALAVDLDLEPARPAAPRPTPLPLSCAEGPAFSAKLVPLKNGKSLLSFADVPASTPLPELVERVRALNEKGVLLHSCDRATAEAFGPKASRLLVGYSAEIPLAGYKPPHKVRNLVKRGAREASVSEVALTEENAARFDRLDAARHGPGSPRVEHTFRTRFEDAQRAFVATAKATGEWSAALTLTRYASGAWHVEQLTRHPEAPVGAMELLIASVIDVLRAEGQAVLNLGGVPLVYPEHDGQVIGLQHFSLRDRAVRGIANALSGMAARRYNIRGLMQFKSKWQPHWEPRYLVGTKGLGLRDVYLMAKACGITGLTN